MSANPKKKDPRTKRDETIIAIHERISPGSLDVSRIPTVSSPNSLARKRYNMKTCAKFHIPNSDGPRTRARRAKAKKKKS